jgi:hypothetical protein
MKSGKLSARKVRGRWYCTQQAVDDFLRPRNISSGLMGAKEQIAESEAVQ